MENGDDAFVCKSNKDIIALAGYKIRKNTKESTKENIKEKTK
ncbi:MAG: hypothetical protein PHE02_02170 [Lachnospiraceae bacterium]|nr:hypothetical protein [Lachnospiraceae bacterium]